MLPKMVKCSLSIFCVQTVLVSLAGAGSGVVNNDGTIDVTLNLRFPPTAGDLNNVRDQVRDASEVLWDASEGQLRFGSVTMTCGAVNEDLADMWVFSEGGRAGVSFACDGGALAVPGRHVSQFLPDSDAVVLAHEFGHLALGLGDEYDEQNRFGNCWGYGPCVETANLTERNHCLMQQPTGVTQTEFCTGGGHDTLVGEGLPCTAGAAPCAANCELFDPATGRYQTTQQGSLCGGDCWTHLAANFPFLAAPAGLPVAAAPAGFANPAFVDNCQSTDTVLLVLDRSGSMAWNTESDSGEVCGNGSDDDGDGTIDEVDDCTQPRLEFVRAAARAWLNLANGQGVRAGVVSFNELAALDASFQDVTNTNLPTLTAAVDSLAAGGNTAIGRALSSTALLFGGEKGAANKTAFLISDGVNTEGETPQSVVPSLTAQGIRVFTISTGGASDDSTLSEVSGGTGGTRIDSRDPRTLVAAFVQQWARYRNTGVVIPALPYSINQKSKIDEPPVEERRVDPLFWLHHGDSERVPPERAPASNTFHVRFEEGTRNASIVLAGNLNDMSKFGVEAILDGPVGSGPSHFESTVVHPNLRVVRDPYFLLLELREPNAGVWTIRVQGSPANDPLQSGTLTVVSDNPRVDIFTSLDRVVVEDPAKPLHLRVTPIYSTTLRNVDLLSAVVKRPDGTTDPIGLTSNFSTGGMEDYAGEVSNMPSAGIYEVRVLMRTGPNTFNDPGESIYSTAPSNKVAVPILERTASEFFFVPKGQRICRSGNPKDCDADGCGEESNELDRDHDGQPAAYDTDTDNDEVPDGVECKDRDQDPDGDGLLNREDPDSDGDGVVDGRDPTRIGTPRHDGESRPCSREAVLALLAAAVVVIAVGCWRRSIAVVVFGAVLQVIILFIVTRCCR